MPVLESSTCYSDIIYVSALYNQYGESSTRSYCVRHDDDTNKM